MSVQDYNFAWGITRERLTPEPVQHREHLHPADQKRLDDAAIMRRWCAGDGWECPNRAEWTEEDTGLRYCAEHAK